jgi:hypothetical protein
MPEYSAEEAAVVAELQALRHSWDEDFDVQVRLNDVTYYWPQRLNEVLASSAPHEYKMFHVMVGSTPPTTATKFDFPEPYSVLRFAKALDAEIRSPSFDSQRFLDAFFLPKAA